MQSEGEGREGGGRGACALYADVQCGLEVPRPRDRRKNFRGIPGNFGEGCLEGSEKKILSYFIYFMRRNVNISTQGALNDCI